MANTAVQTDDLAPYEVEKRTSAAKAVKLSPFYGTAEAVPFVGQSLPLPRRVSEGFMGGQIGQLKKLIWTSVKFRHPLGTQFGIEVLTDL